MDCEHRKIFMTLSFRSVESFLLGPWSCSGVSAPNVLHHPSSFRDWMPLPFSEISTFNCGHFSTSACPRTYAVHLFHNFNTNARVHRSHVARPTTQLSCISGQSHPKQNFPDMWSMIISGNFLRFKIFDVWGLSRSPMFWWVPNPYTPKLVLGHWALIDVVT